LLPVRVLSRLFRRLMIERLAAAHTQGALQFFGGHAALHDADAFRAFLKPLRRINGPILPRPQRSNLHNAKLHPASQALSFLGRPSLSLPTRPRSTGVPET
jgi:hypothetical protein